jgi:predicted nucleic acid-binding protein
VRTFFDSNVVVYAADRSEPRKQAIADALLDRHVRQHTLVTSTQVLQETYDVLTRKKHLPADEALAAVRLLTRREVVPANADFVVRALELCAAVRLPVWDALIVQAALDGRCTTLLSEDLQAGRRFAGLEVVNPFVAGVQEPAPHVAARTTRAFRRRR